MATLVVAIVVGAVVVAVVLSIFVRRHGEAPGPEQGWAPTAEVFRDPGTDRLMRVWTDADGGRHYLAE